MVCLLHRAVARYLLLTHYKAGIQPVPPICPLNRRLLSTAGDEQEQPAQVRTSSCRLEIEMEKLPGGRT